MDQRLSLANVRSRGISFTADEAVAIALELAAAHALAEVAPPFGPPALDSVLLTPDGRAVCRSCAVTPAVFEIGILLETLLPRGGGTKVPGSLRYTIARALLDVDAPPFDSLGDLNAALARHAPADPPGVLRDLYARAAARVPVEITERRRRGASPDELRRQLRAADEQLYALSLASRRPTSTEEPTALPASIPVDSSPDEARFAAPFDPLLIRTEPPFPLPAPRRSRTATWLAAGSIAALAAFGAGYAAVNRLVMHHAALPSVRITSNAPEGHAPAVLDGVVKRDREELAAKSDPGRDVVRAVSRSSGPSFSPSFGSNGTALFFHTGRSSDRRSALESATVGSDDLRVMTIVDDGAKNFHVQPSPDGSQIAFDSDRDGERGVYVADSDGTHVRRVSGDGYAAVPSWSPDGVRLAFVRAEADRPQVWNLWLLDLRSGNVQRVTSYRSGQTWTASWFTDGRRIVYTHEDRVIVRDLADGSTHEYASPIAHRQVRTAAVSPDDRHVIFQVARSGAWLLDLADGSMRCVLTDPSAEEFAWSPDGRRVAFHSRRDGQWGVWFLAPGS